MSADRRDIVDIARLRGGQSGRADAGSRTGDSARARAPKAFLSILYKCCNAYARAYKNAAGTAYESACPRCGARIRVGIGPGGSNRRSFEAG